MNEKGICHFYDDLSIINDANTCILCYDYEYKILTVNYSSTTQINKMQAIRKNLYPDVYHIADADSECRIKSFDF